jgi:hypothetical protein
MEHLTLLIQQHIARNSPASMQAGSSPGACFQYEAGWIFFENRSMLTVTGEKSQSRNAILPMDENLRESRLMQWTYPRS